MGNSAIRVLAKLPVEKEIQCRPVDGKVDQKSLDHLCRCLECKKHTPSHKHGINIKLNNG
eukprot:9739081-Ditylum_brightwellii.AAC.1